MDLNLKNKHPRRIYYLFLVIIFFLASTEIAHSQVKNLSLHLTNVTLEEALAQIVPSNDTTAEQIMAVVEGVITNDQPEEESIP